MLDVTGLTMKFGGLTAVNALSFQARAGEITSVIGPNGAGKTTVFNCITGFYRPTAGSIVLTHPDGTTHTLQKLPGHRIARRARVARTFQNIRLFQGMTVLENLLVAQHNTLMPNVASGLLSVFGIGGYAAHGSRGTNSPRKRRRSGRRSTSFQCRMNAITAASRSLGEENDPCLSTRRCKMLNQISTWFSHDVGFGVNTNRIRRPGSVRNARRLATDFSTPDFPFAPGVPTGMATSVAISTTSVAEQCVVKLSATNTHPASGSVATVRAT